MEEELLFTPAAILGLLAQIDELKDLDVGVTETMDNKLQIQVGDSIYEIEDDNATDIDVDDSVVEEVSEANEQAYEDLDADEEFDTSDDTVESGIIKNLAKDVLVGGLVRLGVKALK